MTNVQESPCRLTSAQYEVVNMLSCLNRPSDVMALKSLLVKFLDSRIQAEFDELYEEGKFSDERMAELAAAHLRTPYESAR